MWSPSVNQLNDILNMWISNKGKRSPPENIEKQSEVFNQRQTSSVFVYLT